MKKINFGSGPDPLEGFTNVDNYYDADLNWDLTQPLPFEDEYDYVLINHVLCTMKPDDVRKVLENALRVLKVGGRVQVIDVDMIKAFAAYHNNKPELLPIEGGSIDYKFTMHLSGFGTRLSLFTSKSLRELLEEVGFINAMSWTESEYDTRPNESLVVTATKGRQ